MKREAFRRMDRVQARVPVKFALVKLTADEPTPPLPKRGPVLVLRLAGTRRNAAGELEIINAT